MIEGAQYLFLRAIGVSIGLGILIPFLIPILITICNALTTEKITYSIKRKQLEDEMGDVILARLNRRRYRGKAIVFLVFLISAIVTSAFIVTEGTASKKTPPPAPTTQPVPALSCDQLDLEFPPPPQYKKPYPGVLMMQRLSDEASKAEGDNPEDTYWHEIGHCNGWPSDHGGLTAQRKSSPP
jgi:hypothetical protein